MTHRIIIQSTRGRADSLKHDVRIAFTLTPGDSTGPSYHFVAFAGMALSSGAEEYREFEWGRELAFATCNLRERDGKNQCVLGNDRSPIVPPGKSSVVSTNGGVNTWSEITQQPFGGAMCYARASGASQNICLVKHITFEGHTAFVPLAAWPRVAASRSVGSSSALVLQAYVIDDADPDGTMLEARDRRRPLFVEPMSCDALPDSSAWRLTEELDGTIHLRRADIMEVLIQRNLTESLERGTGVLARTLGEMKTQLETVTRSLEDTQQRLLVMEKSAVTNQIELQRLTAVETSVAKTQEELTSLAGTRSELAKLELSVHRIQNQASMIDASFTAIADHRIPSIENGPNILDKSLSHIQDQLSSARKATVTTRDRGDTKRGALAVPATIDSLAADAPVSQVRDRPPTREESLVRIHQQLARIEKRVGPTVGEAELGRVPSFQRDSLGIRRSSSPAPVDSILANKPLTTIRRQVTVLDRRMPALEEKMEGLERSLGKIERKVPTIEFRLHGLDNQTQDELSTLQASLETVKRQLRLLDSRVGDVEEKTDQQYLVEDPLSQIPLPTPVVFPSQSCADYD